MLLNFLKTAWRNLLRNKVYSALNIVGLATGMAVALLIGLWVYYQFSYDRFLPGYKQAYQVMYRSNSNGEINTQTSTSYPLADVIKKDVPGVEYVVRTDYFSSHGLVVGDRKIYLPGLTASVDFLKAFQYPLLQGDAGSVLKNMYSIVLTQSTAKALFGNVSPLNKRVRLDNTHDFTVTGVLKDVPPNSTLQFGYIIPYEYLIADGGDTKWGDNSLQTFVALRPGVTYAQVEPLLKPLIERYDIEDYKSSKYEVFLQPMEKWHLFSEFKNGVTSGGFIDYVKLFGIIGLLVLLIACINFMNLSTARSEKRAKEVGIRKAVGSQRNSLILQFLVESVVITFIAGMFSVVLVQLALPAFNELTGAKMAVPYGSIFFWVAMVGYVLLTGSLAGSRPAFYLSSFNPVKVLKGSMKAGSRATLPRKILVTIQFTASIALIISTVIVYQQIEYAKNRPKGYDDNRLVMTDVSPDINKNYDALKNEMLQSGVVTSVTKSSSPVTGVWVINDIDNWQGKLPGETLGIGTIAVSDADFFTTMGMALTTGRNFKNDGTDSQCVILNEAAVKRMRFKQPLNQVLAWNDGQARITVIGVVKNALMESPFGQTRPTLFMYSPGWANIITYKLSPAVGTQQAITKLSGIFGKYNPSYPYAYRFVDDAYAQKFGLETLIGKLAGLFAVLAIFISCIGLFGLAAYTAEQRTKEIGIRKTLGATVGQVWLLLSKEFIALVIISCVAASPLAFYFLNDWLLKYDYRITISPLVFVMAGVTAVFITIVTVSWQAIKAATANPVKSLKAE